MSLTIPNPSNVKVSYSSLSEFQSSTIPDNIDYVLVEGLPYSRNSGGDFTAGDGSKWESLREPIIVLGLGASNMAINANATGGNRRIPSGVYLWDSSQHASSTYTEGSQFNQAAFGSAPLDLLDTGGTLYANSFMLQTCIELKHLTGRPVYGIICAMGGHGPVNYLTDATLSANGWSRSGGTENMTLHYSNIKAAIDAVPGSKDRADIAIWYGTQGAADGQFPFQTQLDLVLDQATTSQLINEARTRVVISTTAPTRSSWANVKQAISRISADRPNVVTIDTMGADMPDSIHLDGDSLTDHGRKASIAGLGGGEKTTRGLVLADGENASTESQAYLDKWNGDNFFIRNYSDEGWIGENWNVNSGVYKLEYYDAVGGTTTEHFRVDTSTGRIGFGESNPQRRVHVTGNVPKVRLEDDSGTGFVGLELHGSSGELASFLTGVGSGNTIINMGNSVDWQIGTGSPEGVVTAGVGSLFTRTDGGVSTTLYVKESGVGNTGWVAK